MLNRKIKMLIGTCSLVALATAACSSPSNGGGGGDGTSSTGTQSAAQAAAKSLGIDLSKCAVDPTKKLTGTINIGQTLALSGGPAAAYAPIGAGARAAIAEYNATSGSGVKLKLIQADDQFQPDKAIAAAQKLIQQDNVAAMTTVIGDPSVLAIRSLLNTRCVPLISGATSNVTSTDLVKFPWITTMTPTSALEAKVWAAKVAELYPDGAKVGVFYADDSTGDGYLAQVKKALAGTKSRVVSIQSIQDTDSSAPASQVTTLKASGAQVLMAAPTGGGCIALFKQVASTGWKPTIFNASQCGANLLDLAGAAANGVYINQYLKDPGRPPYNTDPAVVRAAAALKKYAPGTALSPYSISGYALIEPLFAAVAKAKASPLGLSRIGLIMAAQHLDFQGKLWIPGVKFILNGRADQVSTESVVLTQYNSTTKVTKAVKLYGFEGQITSAK